MGEPSMTSEMEERFVIVDRSITCGMASLQRDMFEMNPDATVADLRDTIHNILGFSHGSQGHVILLGGKKLEDHHSLGDILVTEEMGKLLVKKDPSVDAKGYVVALTGKMRSS